MSDPVPDISVIIPTYSRREALERAVASCFAGNEVLRVEVVVVDDGSTDGTRAWGERQDDERIRYLRQKNQGAPVARNRGLDTASGEYIKFLDDDDWLRAGALEEEVNRLRGSGASISYGGAEVREETGDPFTFHPSDSDDLISGLVRGSVWSHPVLLTYHRDALESVEWDPALDYHQDKDFAVKVASQGLEAVRLDHVVGVLNEHAGERITTTRKKQASVPELVRHRVSSICMAIKRLTEHDALQPHHRRAAAQGLWQWAYIVSPYDTDLFGDIVQKIETIYPNFMPSRERRLLHLLDRLGSPSLTETILRPVRQCRLRIRKAKE